MPRLADWYMMSSMNDDTIQALPDGQHAITYELDLDSGALTWNEGLFTVMGYDKLEPVNSQEWWANHIHPDDAMVLNQKMDMLMYPWVKEWLVDYRLQNAEHRYIQVHDRATVLRDETGKPIRLRGTIWPVS